MLALPPDGVRPVLLALPLSGDLLAGLGPGGGVGAAGVDEAACETAGEAVAGR